MEIRALSVGGHRVSRLLEGTVKKTAGRQTLDMESGL